MSGPHTNKNENNGLPLAHTIGLSWCSRDGTGTTSAFPGWLSRRPLKQQAMQPH